MQDYYNDLDKMEKEKMEQIVIDGTPNELESRAEMSGESIERLRDGMMSFPSLFEYTIESKRNGNVLRIRKNRNNT